MSKAMQLRNCLCAFSLGYVEEPFTYGNHSISNASLKATQTGLKIQIGICKYNSKLQFLQIRLPSIGPGFPRSHKLEASDGAKGRAAAEKAALQTGILSAMGAAVPSSVQLKRSLWI